MAESRFITGFVQTAVSVVQEHLRNAWGAGGSPQDGPGHRA